MPVILDRSAWARWLGDEPAGPHELQELPLKPYPMSGMRAYPFGTRVNSVKNDDAGLIEPLMAMGGAPV